MRSASLVLVIAAVVAMISLPNRNLSVGSQGLGVLIDDTSSLSIARGMANKCCGAAGTCYQGESSQGNCYGPLPYQCSCRNTGAATWVLSQTKIDTICKSTNKIASCEDGEAEDCFRKSNGTCDDDGGGWSWLGFCYVCGPGNLVLGAWEGTRNRCSGDPCTDAVPVG